ncbi:MAG TPA: EAL domain-containing protein [Sphingomonas sp.]|jgi:diguanylate cyclase (GGDEF)-like protein|uniref:putative bifunctional diguanylate cyclase/phosphodiesterase n=1 Tax=Sphingomonas sp. TaxID=28214 RepID=UPI002EDB9AF3
MIPRFTLLRTRLTLAFAGMFAVVLFVAGLTLQVAISRTAEKSVAHDLSGGVVVFDRLWTLRSDQLRQAAAMLAQDYGFRAAAATGDTATTESALHNLRKRIGIPAAFLLTVDGQVVGLNATDARSAALLSDRLDDGKSEGIVQIGDALYQAVATPVRAPTLIGWAVFAVRLDGRAMQSLTKLSAIPFDASVVRRDAHGLWRSGGAAVVPELAAALTPLDGRRSATLALDTARGRTLTRVEPLAGFDPARPALLVLQYPLDAALAVYRPLEYLLWGIGLIGLAAVALGTARLSKSITRPIAVLDNAVRRLESGDAVQVEIRSGDEIERLAGSFNRMVAAIGERERKISHLAFHDPLTGLPNRALLRTQVDELLRRSLHQGREVAVFALDLDDFKGINDSLGHLVGDAVLTRLAAIMTEVAGNAFVARLGGDEFSILLECGGRQAPEALARALLDRLSRPIEVEGHSVPVGTSIGIAMAPGDGSDSSTLLKNADLALYRAKAEGRATFRYFEAGMDAAARARRVLEADLRQALQEGAFELHYQPLFDLSSNRVTAFEALVRWRHPVRGLVSPIEFIPVAEETGLIVPLGEWVIRQATREAATWPAPVRIAVNVSPIQFGSPGLLATLVDALARSGLEPGRLEVEITESIFLADSGTTLATLHSLRSLGVRIALDDFGTGFSSLSYLRSFPFDKIKIDRSFITDLLKGHENIAIVRAITHLARAMGMETTAEGVEDPEQLAALRLEGCTNVQGFLFSRPVPASQVIGLFEMSQAPERKVA